MNPGTVRYGNRNGTTAINKTTRTADRFSAPDLFPAVLERGHREMLSDTYATEPVENRSLILGRSSISLWTL